MSANSIEEHSVLNPEERIKELEHKVEELTDFIENGSIPLHRVDENGIIIWANQSELDALGYSRNEYVGQPISKFHADQEVIKDILAKLTANETLNNYPARLMRKDGTVRHVLINSNVYRKNGKFVHTRCFTRDVTDIYLYHQKRETLLQEVERKNQELAESEARFRTVADSAPVLLWMTDEHKKFNFFNKTWLDFTGENSGEAIHGWTNRVHPDDLDSFTEVFETSFTEQKPFDAQFRIRCKDGKYKWLLTHGVPRRSANGEFAGLIGTCTDIELQKNFAQKLEMQVQERTEELKRLNLLLEKRNDELLNNNSELKAFSYMASHDLQEPLRKIQAFADLLRHDAGSTVSAKGDDYVERILNASKRMQELISSLLNYSRVSTDRNTFEKTNLNEVFVKAIEILSDSIEDKKATIQKGKLPTVDAVPVQMLQLFTNLLSNSMKYTRPGIAPVINISVEKITGRETGNNKCDAESSYWHFTFKDNGIGFEPQYSEAIFELFRRLHSRSEFEGTGIGLGICKRIVANHRGFIKAEGFPMEGSVFHVYIPVKIN
jgi:PAS domain S-box-containing protein